MANASLKKCLTQTIQVTSLGCSKTCYSSNIVLEENHLPPTCLFYKLISMQNVGHMLHMRH